MNHSVAVRALCEFTARAGDLDLRFTPAPTGPEGVAGHATVVARRAAGYETEVALSGQYETLSVRGRADGYDPGANQLEEIKTYRGDIDGIRENQRALHWAQACVYGHLLCQTRELRALRVALVYFNLVSQEETVLVRDYDAATLREFFETQCRGFIAWARSEHAHRLARDEALRQLSFPLAQFRAGQRELAVAVYRTARQGGSLLAQASTGIGKTLGTLFPLLKAAPQCGIDKVFFLAAKNAGKGLARHALAQINAAMPSPRLRVLDLQARDKVCEYPDRACHGESCPLAKGFYDRLPAARAAAFAATPAVESSVESAVAAAGAHPSEPAVKPALEFAATAATADPTVVSEAAPGVPSMDGAALRKVALAHQVCPYYLSQELARWADVVVADYNYYYDANAMLHAYTQHHQWRVAVLVDEAHNLVDRARQMYTGKLSQRALTLARQSAPKTLRRPIDGLARSWNALNRKQTERYEVYDSVPAGVLAALQKFLSAISEHLGQTPLAQRDPLLQFYFDALQFTKLAEQFGSHAMFDVTQDTPGPREAVTSTLCVRNVTPAPYLASRYAAAHATVLFSATLDPQRYYRDTLGLPAHTGWIEVAAPFTADQLTVKVVGHVSTRYRDRAASLAPIVEVIAAQYARRPGNYLSFFSSFDYLDQVAGLLAQRHPDIPVWRQTPGMDEASRARFLERFTQTGRGLGFAVLGGAFSEAIDLPGNRLIGAFIATLGLPQVNPVTEHMRRAMDKLYGTEAGYDYTYLYPGLQKVVQAAGRVIRGETDKGWVFLIDDRYRRSKVRALLPRWWRVE